VVNTDPSALTEQVLAIAEGAFCVVGVDSYEVGRELLGRMPPDVIVTAVRLGRHNGLHLALLASLNRSIKATIVVGEADPVLQAEAGKVNARYLVSPYTRADLQGVVTRVVSGNWSPRSWPRLSVTRRIRAEAGNISARITNISYGGVRLELTDAETLSGPFVLTLPHAGIAIAARPIWCRRGERGLECGAALPGSEGPALDRWRALVDHERGIGHGQSL
jgi:hypothetical protein